MGFRKIYISKYHRIPNTKEAGIEIIQVGKIEQLVRSLFDA
jgi:hypothetical protein